MPINHQFVSTVPDGPDASLVRPSDWNDGHTLPTLAELGITNAQAVEPTGTADNVTVQAAIDALAVTGGIVTMAPGAYAWAADVTFTGAKPVLIMAYGATITLAAGVTSFNPQAATAPLTIEGAYFNGQGDAGTIAVDLEDTNHCVAKNLIIENCGIGVRLHSNAVNKFVEGTLLDQITFRQCAASVDFAVTSGTGSFANTIMRGIKMVVGTGGIGFNFAPGITSEGLYRSFIQGTAWVDAGEIGWVIDGNVSGSHFQLAAEGTGVGYQFGANATNTDRATFALDTVGSLSTMVDNPNNKVFWFWRQGFLNQSTGAALLRYRRLGDTGDRLAFQLLTTGAAIHYGSGVAATDAAIARSGAGELTITGRVVTQASATGGAGLRAPHGTAPSSPVNGDIWTTTAGAFARINGVTTELGAGSAATVPPAGPTYVVDLDSGTYRGWNLSTGAIDFSDADAAVVINAIIAAMPSSTAANQASGGLIFLTRNVYLCGEPIIINKRSVHLMGVASKHGSILVQNANFAANRAVIEVGFFTAGVVNDVPAIQDVEVDHLSIYGKRGDGTVTTGIGIRMYASRSKIHDVTLNEINNHGVVIDGPSATNKGYEVELADIYVVNFGRDGVYTADGFRVEANISDADIKFCYAHQGSAGADRGRFGLYGKGGTVRHLGVHTYFCKSAGILYDAGGTLWFTDCISESNVGAGIDIAGPDAVHIHGGGYYANDIDATDGSATTQNIRLGNVAHFTLGGFVMEKRISSAPNPVRNIFVSGCEWGVIYDMVMMDAQTDQIAISSSQEVTMHDVSIREGRTYGDINGRTPSTGIRISGSSSKVKVHDCILEDQNITEQDTADNNEIYNNTLYPGTGGATLTVIGANTRAYNNKGANQNGATVASANNFDPGFAVKYVVVSGTTTINGLRTSRFDIGDSIVLQFQGALTLTHGGSPGAGYAALLLNGGNFTTAAGDKVTFLWNGTNFVETARVDFT